LSATITIAIVVVAFIAGWIAEELAVTMTSTFWRTSSAA
jgi:hypothetical protein